VNVISKRGLHLLLKGKSLDVAEEVASWFKTATTAHWGSIRDVRQSFPMPTRLAKPWCQHPGKPVSVDRHRVLSARTIYLKALLTHKEYDREEWKKWRNYAKPTKYGRLCATVLPKVIETDAEFDRLVEVWNPWTANRMRREEAALRDLLEKLIKDYDDSHYSSPTCRRTK